MNKYPQAYSAEYVFRNSEACVYVYVFTPG
jgi:hypothetical protein